MRNKNLQESSHRIVLSMRLETCPLALLWVAEDTETKFRAVHKILVDNYYEVLMVEAGAKRYVPENSNPHPWMKFLTQFGHILRRGLSEIMIQKLPLLENYLTNLFVDLCQSNQPHFVAKGICKVYNVALCNSPNLHLRGVGKGRPKVCDIFMMSNLKHCEILSLNFVDFWPAWCEGPCRHDT